MAQIAAPIADSQNPGLWTGYDASDCGTELTSNLYTVIDGDPIWGLPDAGNAQSPSKPTASEFYECLLATLFDPQVGNGHVVAVMWGMTATSGAGVNCHVELWEDTTANGQGDTLRAQLGGVAPNTLVDCSLGLLGQENSWTLTAPQADAIVDYSKLHLRFVGETILGGPPRALCIAAAQLSVPDEPAVAWVPEAFRRRQFDAQTRAHSL